MLRYFFTVFLLLVSVGIPVVLSNIEAKNAALAENNKLEENVELSTEAENEEEPTEESSKRNPLEDISGHWAEKAIMALYSSHVVNGYEDGNFGPDDPVTRTQYLTITFKAFGHELENETWADYAYSIGVISDLDRWKNKGDENVSRAEALKVLIELSGMEANSGLTPNFPDVDIINDWFANYAAFALAQKISTGDAEGNFNGNTPITRAETCVLTVRIMEKLPSNE